MKFGQAVGQKELEKALHEDADISKAHLLRARIEFVAEAADIKERSKFIEGTSLDESVEGYKCIFHSLPFTDRTSVPT
jgi:hypothetical protein